ncbi:MAG: hypothetical protein FK730_15935 [Asgard group archaeon]|nr:hypothetical protein [Asgard group archaeon]
MNIRKILLASWGPIKTMFISWGFLIMIIAFIYFIFFDPKGLLNFQSICPLTFNVVNMIVSGLLFLYWLVVWNTMIKAFFKEDLKYLEKNGIKLEEVNG